MGILDDLTAGSSTNENKNNNEDELFSVYVQFDEDDVIMLSKDIQMKDEFTLTLHPEDKNYLVIKDTKTDKQIKIFVKINK